MMQALIPRYKGRRGNLAARIGLDYAHLVRSHSSGPLVVCYHSVSDHWPHALAVTTRSFERQLRSLLLRGYRPVPADGLLGSSPRGLHVTFDDAFRDVLDVVSAMRTLGVEATVFASTSFADEGRVFDIPELADEAATHRERLATMSWDDLRELGALGFEVGSHTVTHAHLPELGDEELDRELVDSRARIQDELGRPCRLLAYPYGEHDARIQAAARRAGYDAAFALWAGSDLGNAYAYPRIDFYRRDSQLRARLKTSFLKPHASALLERMRTRYAS